MLFAQLILLTHALFILYLFLLFFRVAAHLRTNFQLPAVGTVNSTVCPQGEESAISKTILMGIILFKTLVPHRLSHITYRIFQMMFEFTN